MDCSNINPFEVAVFLKTENFPIKEEYRIIDAIWESRESFLSVQYCTNKKIFKKAVSHELNKLDGMLKDIAEINMILIEIGSKHRIDGSTFEHDVVASYFKVIKLRLVFAPGREYCRVKLRTIISSFGYKRRSLELVSTMNQVIGSLGLKTYLRGRESCEIGSVLLDKVISIRLEQPIV